MQNEDILTVIAELQASQRQSNTLLMINQKRKSRSETDMKIEKIEETEI